MSHLLSAPSWCGAQWPVYRCTGFQHELFWWNSANCQSKHWYLGTMFVKMPPCLSIAGHSMEWVGCFPLCCFAEPEVGPRSLCVLGKCSTVKSHPCLHPSCMLLKCHNVQSANVRMYFQSRKHFCADSPSREISVQLSIVFFQFIGSTGRFSVSTPCWSCALELLRGLHSVVPM